MPLLGRHHPRRRCQTKSGQPPRRRRAPGCRGKALRQSQNRLSPVARGSCAAGGSRQGRSPQTRPQRSWPRPGGLSASTTPRCCAAEIEPSRVVRWALQGRVSRGISQDRRQTCPDSHPGLNRGEQEASKSRQKAPPGRFAAGGAADIQQWNPLEARQTQFESRVEEKAARSFGGQSRSVRRPPG